MTDLLNLRRLWVWLTVVALCSGCGTPAKQTDPGSPSTSFGDLKAALAARHPREVQVDLRTPALPRTLDITPFMGVDGREDFARWCKGQSGVLGSTDAKTRADATAADSIYRAHVVGYINKMFVETCSVGARTYILLVASGVEKNQYRRTAWVAPEEVDRYGPAAELQVAEMRRKEAEKQRAEQAKRDAYQKDWEEQLRRRDAAILATLKDSAKGTQLVCTARQAPGEDITSLVFECGSFNVHYPRFAAHGWKVTSQSVAVDTTPNGYRGYRVDLVMEKSK